MNQELLHKLFDYRDGELIWAVKFTDKVVVGNIVGHISKGRKYTKINKKDYQLSRLIFFYHHGYLPRMVDHSDGNPLNNRIENLRACNVSQNNYNSKKPVNNTSGFKNVRWEKSRNKWRVDISVDGKGKLIGRFEDLELAEIAAIEARDKYHKEFARHE